MMVGGGRGRKLYILLYIITARRLLQRASLYQSDQMKYASTTPPSLKKSNPAHPARVGESCLILCDAPGALVDVVLVGVDHHCGVCREVDQVVGHQGELLYDV